MVAAELQPLFADNNLEVLQTDVDALKKGSEQIAEVIRRNFAIGQRRSQSEEFKKTCVKLHQNQLIGQLRNGVRFEFILLKKHTAG
jgi:hypothetical protein